MHKKFYENEFEPTSIAELDFVRSPFYELSQMQHLKEGPESVKLMSDLTQKLLMINPLQNQLRAPGPSPDRIAFTRYADKIFNPEFEHLF
jgi:hypothetical protein